MIDAKELRIGNYVYDDTTKLVDTVWGIKPDRRNHVMVNDTEIESIKPIPLTEQWLIDFGFTTCDDSWFYSLELGDNLDSFKICALYTNEVLNGSFALLNCRACSVRFNHVHQLQNLYFALTGKELTKQNNPL
jgi:hypothetical protein